MTKLFLSHSSKDNAFVRKLGADLKKLGFGVWFDEWDIKVGDCIVQKIEEGIAGSDFLIIVLTPESVESGWVDHEWKATFWKEVDQKRVILLPVLLKDCKIPDLISSKKYADFRGDYSHGLTLLTQAIDPKTDISVIEIQQHDYQAKISSLLEKVHSNTVPLSQCFTELLTIALGLENKELIEFCKNELGGWRKRNGLESLENIPKYRIIKCYYSVSEININYVGWAGNINNAFSYMRSNPDEFIQGNSFHAQPISELESYGTNDKAILAWTQNLGSINEKAKNPEATIFFYAPGSSYSHLLEAIKTELTKKLLSLLTKD